MNAAHVTIINLAPPARIRTWSYPTISASASLATIKQQVRNAKNASRTVRNALRSAAYYARLDSIGLKLMARAHAKEGFLVQKTALIQNAKKRKSFILLCGL
jgi:hypothetical protein